VTVEHALQGGQHGTDGGPGRDGKKLECGHRSYCVVSHPPASSWRRTRSTSSGDGMLLVILLMRTAMSMRLIERSPSSTRVSATWATSSSDRRRASSANRGT